MCFFDVVNLLLTFLAPRKDALIRTLYFLTGRDECVSVLWRP